MSARVAHKSFDALVYVALKSRRTQNFDEMSTIDGKVDWHEGASQTRSQSPISIAAMHDSVCFVSTPCKVVSCGGL